MIKEVYMENLIQSAQEWYLAHKKQLEIAGIAIGVGVLAVLGIKYGEELLAHFQEVQKVAKAESLPCNTNTALAVSKAAAVQATESIAAENTTVSITETITALSTEIQTTAESRTIAPHDVSACLMKLPEGKHASLKKIATAAANGFDPLPPEYTWKVSYTTGDKVA